MRKSISFAAELTKDTPDPEVATSRMRREIERLSQLVATLLDVTSAEGDPELLRRAVENVLRNAIQVAPGDSRVSVKVQDNGSTVTVRVRDCGPGVPEDLLARIFDPFFRVDESRDGAGGGTGLGLSIARRAVLLHHGEITAENASPGLRVNLVIPCLQR
jgi:two-component system sensor histidine kinase CpxA